MKLSGYRNNFILVGLIVIIAISIFFYRSLAKDVISQTNISNSNISGADQLISSEYKNGEYSATGGYVSPGGQEEITVNVTLSNDIIENVQFESSSGNPTSIFFQEKFISGFRELVVGKNINEVKLDHVAGSSLTPIGFNEAIEKIKAQAKS